MYFDGPVIFCWLMYRNEYIPLCFLYRSAICRDFLLGTQKSGVGRPKLHGHWSVGLPALPYKWHCQNFKLAWLKEQKTIEELRLVAAVQRIRRSTLGSRSKGGLSDTAGILFILPQTGTVVGKDGPWNKCLSTRNWQFTVKFATVQNTWNFVPKINTFLQLFSCVDKPDLPELTFIFNSLFIVLQLKIVIKWILTAE